MRTIKVELRRDLLVARHLDATIEGLLEAAESL
jgi:hypothetical protein